MSLQRVRKRRLNEVKQKIELDESAHALIERHRIEIANFILHSVIPIQKLSNEQVSSITIELFSTSSNIPPIVTINTSKNGIL